MEKTYDIVIIGAGIIGSALAYELSKYDLNVILLEKENDIAMHTTKANSGIIHGGYDPKPNTLMAKLNVEGNKLIKEFAKKTNVNFKLNGSLVVGNTTKDIEMINSLYQRGLDNKVEGLELIKNKDEIHKIEPNLNDDINYGLICKSAGIISPWELALSLSYNAVSNGVKFINNANIKSIKKDKDIFVISYNDKKLFTKFIFNSAGLYADEIYKLVLPKEIKSFEITPCKGEYYLLDKNQGDIVKHVIFQTPSNLGKGVLVSPTVHGNLIVGPNASYDTNKKDVSVTSDALEYIRNVSMASVKNINFFANNIRNFVRLRSVIKRYDDFLIEESAIVKGFFNFAGIKSPGLSASMAIGKYALSLLSNAKCNLKEKKNYKYYSLPTFFSHLNDKEKEDLIKEDNRYRQVICRCELVTEKEIINSLHAPIKATTIDGVKRRTNAGMGRY